MKKDSHKLLLMNNFIESFRWSLVSPFMPLFYYSLAGSFILLNMVQYSSAFISSIFAIIWARLSDSYGRRKPFIIMAYTAGIVTTYLTAHVGNIYQLFLIRLAGSVVGSAGGSTFSALLAKKFREKRGSVLGSYKTLGIAGSFAGNMLSGYVYERYGIRTALELISFTTVVPLLIVLAIDEEPEERKSFRIKDIFIPPKMPPVFKKYFLLHLYLMSIGTITGSIHAVYFTEYLNGSPSLWALVVSITVLLSGTSAIYGVLADKYGAKFNILYATIGWTLLNIGYMLSNDPLTFAIVYVVPIGAAYWVAYEKALFDASDYTDRATFFSFLGIISSIYSLALGTIGGFIADMYEPRTLFLLSAIISALGSILAWKYIPSDSKPRTVSS